MASETEQMKPNIVIILVDDLGWNDVSYHGKNVSTPNIDRLAKAGVELDRFYVNPTCSPTRASLMSGEFATTHGVDSPVQWHSKTGLPLNHRILPQFLKSKDTQHISSASGIWAVRTEITGHNVAVLIHFMAI